MMHRHLIRGGFMASVKNSDIPEIFQFMGEFWPLIKDYWIVENTDEYWNEVIERTSQLGKKYNHEFGYLQIRAFMDYLTEEYKRKYGMGNQQ